MKLSNIEITSIVPPEVGWPIVAHCYVCGKTEIVLSIYAAKPEKGDYWLFNGMCLDEDQMTNIRHNLIPQYEQPWRVQNLESHS